MDVILVKFKREKNLEVATKKFYLELELSNFVKFAFIQLEITQLYLHPFTIFCVDSYICVLINYITYYVG